MRVRFLLAAAASALVVGLIPSPAMAQDVTSGQGTVLANLTSSGTRSITLVDPIIANSGIGLVAGDTYGVQVVEVLRSGTANWTVSAKVCGDLTPGVVGGAVDCTGQDNRLTSTTSTATLGGSAITLSSRAVTETDLLMAGSTSTAPGGSATLGSAAELFHANQSTGTIYSETYNASGSFSITPPAGQAAEVYEGYFVVTLV